MGFVNAYPAAITPALDLAKVINQFLENDMTSCIT